MTKGRTRTRQLVLGTAAACALAFLPGAAGSAQAAPAAEGEPEPVCTASGCTVEFTFTGGEQYWTAPAGVTRATVTLQGGSGGEGGGPSFEGHAPGGAGAEVVATIPVTPGSTYQVRVGGAGHGDGQQAGGYNGGGGGDTYGNTHPLAGGGGGASDLRSGAYTLTDRLVVAGGGGGGGGNGRGDGPAGDYGPLGGTGGASGAGTPATTGAAALDDPETEGGAGGASGTSGGTGGAGGNSSFFDSYDGEPGEAGTPGQGGAIVNSEFWGGHGGGGGGGYVGGGSGGDGGSNRGDSSGAGGGGGGGSNYVLPSATDVTITDGVHRGDGAVTITYQQAPTITSADSATFTVTRDGSFTVTATGLPAPTYSAAGALPEGVTLSADGALSGVPASGTAGSYPLTVTADNGVDPPAVQQFTLVVRKLAQTIGFTSPPPAATVDGTPYTPTATATSGLPVTISVDDVSSSVCTADAGSIAFLATGDCVLHADQSGDADYLAAEQVTQTITVSRVESSLEVSGPTKVTVGEPADFDVTLAPATTDATSARPVAARVATGAVTFRTGATELGSATLDDTGTATLTTSSLPVGTHTLTFDYAGDAAFGRASATFTLEVVAGAPAPAPTDDASGPTATATDLPPTGFGSSGLLGAAGVLLAAGAGLVLASRQRLRPLRTGGAADD